MADCKRLFLPKKKIDGFRTIRPNTIPKARFRLSDYQPHFVTNPSTNFRGQYVNSIIWTFANLFNPQLGYKILRIRQRIRSNYRLVEKQT